MRLHSDSGCPAPATLAAVADGSLPTAEREAVSAHIADCERCLGELAAIVRLGRDQDRPLPASLRARVARPPRPTWQTAAAVAATFVLSVSGWWLMSPSGQPSQPPEVRVDDVVRSGASGAEVPLVTHPPANGQLSADAVSFSWRPVASALTYRLRVMRDDGQLVWEGETSTTTARLGGASLPQALPLYIAVTAVLPDGRTARAPAVPFSVARE